MMEKEKRFRPIPSQKGGYKARVVFLPHIDKSPSFDFVSLEAIERSYERKRKIKNLFRDE